MTTVITNKADLEEIITSSVEKALEQVKAASKSIEQKEWITNKEARELTGLSKSTLQRFRSSGILPFSKIRGNIFYRYEDICSVLEQHKNRV